MSSQEFFDRVDFPWADHGDQPFHSHLDDCRQCREQPFELCSVGQVLIMQIFKRKGVSTLENKELSFNIAFGKALPNLLPTEIDRQISTFVTNLVKSQGQSGIPEGTKITYNWAGKEHEALVRATA